MNKDKEKKVFEEPIMEVIEIKKEEIITCSGNWGDPGDHDID